MAKFDTDWIRFAARRYGHEKAKEVYLRSIEAGNLDYHTVTAYEIMLDGVKVGEVHNQGRRAGWMGRAGRTREDGTLFMGATSWSGSRKMSVLDVLVHRAFIYINAALGEDVIERAVLEADVERAQLFVDRFSNTPDRVAKFAASLAGRKENLERFNAQHPAAQS